MQSSVTTVVAVVAAGCGSVSSDPGREYPRLSLVDASGTVLFDRDLRGLITDHAVSLDESGITIAGNFQERLEVVTALALEPGASVLAQGQGSSVILTYPYWDGSP